MRFHWKDNELVQDTKWDLAEKCMLPVKHGRRTRVKKVTCWSGFHQLHGQLHLLHAYFDFKRKDSKVTSSTNSDTSTKSWNELLCGESIPRSQLQLKTLLTFSASMEFPLDKCSKYFCSRRRNFISTKLSGFSRWFRRSSRAARRRKQENFSTQRFSCFQSS